MTGYQSKRAAAQDKLVVTDIDGHVVRHARKSKKAQPPQRPWVGLTDAEAQWIYNNCRTPSNLIDMVETMLKEKNT